VDKNLEQKYIRKIGALDEEEDSPRSRKRSINSDEDSAACQPSDDDGSVWNGHSDDSEDEADSDLESKGSAKNAAPATPRPKPSGGARKKAIAPASNWNYGRWLMGMSLEELQRMKPADELYLKTLQKNIGIIEERMSSMMLGDENVEMTKYPSETETEVFHNTLRLYNGDYDESIRDRAGLKKMGRINRFFTCPKHTKFSEHGNEFVLCGEAGCNLCPRMPRVSKLGDTDLTKEVLTFCPLPRLDSTGKEFLPIDECQLLLDKGATLEEELADLNKLRGDFDENDDIQKTRKARDTKLTKNVNWTKVRKVLTCDDCRAPRCVFSRLAVSNKGGPQKKHMTALERFVEQNGFKCGDVVRIYADGKSDAERAEGVDTEEVPLLFCRESLVCGTSIESQYYAPGSDPQRGRRIATKHLCCHCYSDRGMASKKYVQAKHTLGGKGFLPICKHCVDDGATPVFKKGRPNQLEKANEERQGKRAARETHKRAKQS
jgi:hypothetical protein